MAFGSLLIFDVWIIKDGTCTFEDSGKNVPSVSNGRPWMVIATAGPQSEVSVVSNVYAVILVVDVSSIPVSGGLFYRVHIGCAMDSFLEDRLCALLANNFCQRTVLFYFC